MSNRWRVGQYLAGRGLGCYDGAKQVPLRESGIGRKL